jgi:putative oxygen-independent coproporphyrinogen III oxidase
MTGRPNVRRTEHHLDDFGVYVHVPFCAKRCDYCAFATWTGKDALFGDYVESVIAEISGSEEPAATSVFFGGGTPSMLPPEMLGSMLDRIPRTDDSEVTVECNPDTVSAEMFATYVRHGVNRVSFGVQSMVPHVLDSLGRTHRPENVRTGMEQAREAGLLVNIDLIYGAVGETSDDWNATVEEVLRLDPGHLSAYALTVEANTPLADDGSRHPDDDDEADKYARIDALLAEAGYRNYEISNWARPGNESRHNLLYWAQGDYRGYGCAAHSHREGRRFWNVRTPERFIELLRTTGSAESASETLEPGPRRLEGLQLALRTRVGVPVGAFHADDLAMFIEAGLVTINDGQVRLSSTGRMMANTVAVRLVAD